MAFSSQMKGKARILTISGPSMGTIAITATSQARALERSATISAPPPKPLITGLNT